MRKRDQGKSDGDTMSQDKTEGPSFNEALEELEGILERIEGEEIDIDSLATELGRGSELLDLCRSKIRKAELEVLQIVERLEDPVSEADPSDTET